MPGAAVRALGPTLASVGARRWHRVADCPTAGCGLAPSRCARQSVWRGSGSGYMVPPAGGGPRPSGATAGRRGGRQRDGPACPADSCMPSRRRLPPGPGGDAASRGPTRAASSRGAGQACRAAGRPLPASWSPGRRGLQGRGKGRGWAAGCQTLQACLGGLAAGRDLAASSSAVHASTPTSSLPNLATSASHSSLLVFVP